MKNVQHKIIFFLLMFFLINCGGGSSAPSSTSGVAFYIDAAVEGVSYECGIHEGATSSDGSFTFEKDKDCLFTLGEMQLREIKPNFLTDGQKLYEKDIKIARILQSLDANPDLYKLTVNDKIVQKINENNYTSIPDEFDEFENLLALIVEEGGVYIDASTAQYNLDIGFTYETLSGEELYALNENKILTILDFNKEMTELTITLKDKKQNNKIISTKVKTILKIDGKYIRFSDGTYYKLLTVTDTYIDFEDSATDILRFSFNDIPVMN